MRGILLGIVCLLTNVPCLPLQSVTRYTIPVALFQSVTAAPLPQVDLRLVGTWEYSMGAASITLKFLPDGRFFEVQRYAGHTVQSSGVYLVDAMDAVQLRILRFIEEYTPSSVIAIPIRDELTVTWQDVATLRTPFGLLHRKKGP